MPAREGRVSRSRLNCKARGRAGSGLRAWQRADARRTAVHACCSSSSSASGAAGAASEAALMSPRGAVSTPPAAASTRDEDVDRQREVSGGADGVTAAGNTAAIPRGKLLSDLNADRDGCTWRAARCIAAQVRRTMSASYPQCPTAETLANPDGTINFGAHTRTKIAPNVIAWNYTRSE